MADPKMDVSPERRLRGKVNFTTWKSEFEREAKAHDVLDLFTGDEEILEKPKKEDYIDYDDEKDSNTIASTQKSLKNFHANTLRYTIDYNNWRTNKDSLRTANKLLNAWVSDSIRIEIELAKNAKEAYDLIVTRYRVSTERARDDLLSNLRKLTIDDCDDVTDYLNKLRRFKSDLAGVDFELTDGLYVTALLDGLDNKKWISFKEKWHTIRVIQLDANPDAPPSINLLEDQLHHEALAKQRREEERKQSQTKEKTKTKYDNSTHVHHFSNNNKSEDKAHLKCEVCGKMGHTEENCWKVHPEKIPRALRDKIQSKNDEKGESTYKQTMADVSSGKMAACAVTDVR
jgi:hypothetical protein